MKAGRIIKVSGPLVIAENMTTSKMYEVVRVSSKNLIGEIIELKQDKASIQVYEETAGIGVGEEVIATGRPLTVELGPGLIGNFYDGIQRPLETIMKKTGSYIQRGVEMPGLDRSKIWQFIPKAKKGDKVLGGDILGEVQETVLVVHKIMVPPDIKGVIEDIREGSFTVADTIAKVKLEDGSVRELNMIQRWPVRMPRPIKEKLVPSELLATGQRVIDTLFPLAKGGTACIPGPFGSGKTVVQHQLAKWTDADIVVYIGCGERGNEMTDVLMEFPKLKDPKSGEPLMNRTVLIANTSNMPVAAREASVYIGITIAEYFRDMGYNVAVMADSTSRWAEALREISGRLEEMPGEEGYPAYLAYKIAEFYERAGKASCLCSSSREGCLSVVGAVSPPGGDLSDPVVQATLRVVKVFWGLDDKLAYQRHFPAINWLISYSLYLNLLTNYFDKSIAPDWMSIRNLAMSLLQEESELLEIARLVGIESLADKDRLTLDTAKSIREDFLHQHAFNEIDTYTSLQKQYKMLSNITLFHNEAKDALSNGVLLKDILILTVKEDIARSKYILENELAKFNQIREKIVIQIDSLIEEKNNV